MYGVGYTVRTLVPPRGTGPGSPPPLFPTVTVLASLHFPLWLYWPHCISHCGCTGLYWPHCGCTGLYWPHCGCTGLTVAVLDPTVAILDSLVVILDSLVATLDSLVVSWPPWLPYWALVLGGLRGLWNQCHSGCGFVNWQKRGFI